MGNTLSLEKRDLRNLVLVVVGVAECSRSRRKQYRLCDHMQKLSVGIWRLGRQRQPRSSHFFENVQTHEYSKI
jgi:hypothetical protein